MLWCCCEPVIAPDIGIEFSYQGQSYLDLGNQYNHVEGEYGAVVSGVKFRTPFQVSDIEVVAWFRLFFETPGLIVAPTTATLRLPAWPGPGATFGAIPNAPFPAVYEQRVSPKIEVLVYGINQDPPGVVPWIYGQSPFNPPTQGTYLGPARTFLNGQSTTDIDVTQIVVDIMTDPSWQSGDYLTFLVTPNIANYTSGPPWNPNYWSAWISDYVGSELGNRDGLNRATLAFT